MEARKQRRALAAVSRDLEEGSLAYGRVGIQGSQEEVWVPLSSTNTPGTQDRGGKPPCARVPSRTRLFLLPLWIFFSASAEASYRSANRRFAHPHPRERANRKIGRASCRERV